MPSKPESLSPKPSRGSRKTCSKMTKWGKCSQPPSLTSGLCTFHQTWKDKKSTPDSYYEQKIVQKFLQPVADYLSPAEMHAIINGRYRGDGRRVDQYVSDDGLDLDTDYLEHGDR